MMENRLSGSSGRFVIIAAVVVLIYVIAPMLVVLSLSVTESPFPTFPPQGFTLSWYRQILADPEFQHSFMVSLVLASVATFFGLLLGVPAAFALNRWKIPGGGAIEAALLSPMILPILITGLALLKFFAVSGMRIAPVNLFIGHILITMPYILRTVTASLKLVDRNLEDAATTLGASPIVVFWNVTLPQIVPGVLAGSLFAFLLSFDDFSISYWLGDASAVPLPIFLHNAVYRILDPSIAAMSSLTIFTGFIAVLCLEKIVGLRKAMGV